MAGKTKYLERMPRKTPEVPSPFRTSAPSVSPTGVSFTAIQWAEGNMAMQRAAGEVGGDGASVRSKSALNVLSVPRVLHRTNVPGREGPGHVSGSGDRRVSDTEVPGHVGNQAAQHLAKRASLRSGTSTMNRLVDAARSTSGMPLDPQVRQGLEPTLGDVSDLRVHADRQAADASRALHTPAFTIGRDLFFGRGMYAPSTPAGREIIAHEAAHGVQQRFASPTSSPLVTPDGAAELDARRSAETGAPSVHRASQQAVMLYSHTVNVNQLVAEFNAHDEDWYDRLDYAPAFGAHLYELALENPIYYFTIVPVVTGLETPAERKTVVAAFMKRAGTAGLDELARTPKGPWLLESLRNVFDFSGLMGSKLDLPDRLQLDAAIGRAEGRTTAEGVLDTAARQAAQGELLQAEFVDPAEIADRLRLVRLLLSRLQTQYAGDVEIEPAIETVASDLDLLFPATTTGFEGDAGQLALTQTIVDRCARSLSLFDRMLTARGSTADPLNFHFLGLAGRVRSAWIAALKDAVAPEGPKLLAVAEAQSAALREALNELYLGSVANRVSYLSLLEASAGGVASWAQWVQAQSRKIRAETAAIGAARRDGADEDALRARERQVQANAEIVRLSIDGIQIWELAIRAHEQIYAGTGWLSQFMPHIPLTFRDASRIRLRCEKMREAALRGDLAQTRALVAETRDAPDVQAFFQHVPLFIAGANVFPSMIGELLVSFGILKVASIAGHAAGRLVTVGEGASLRAVAAQVALESLAFTAVSRTLQSAVGQSPRSSFLLDLAFNIGLFGLMRFTGSVIQRSAEASGLELLAAPATHAVNFPLLQATGFLHFRIENGRWPSSDEMRQMTADGLILYAALVKTAPRPKKTPSRTSTSLELLHTHYAKQLAEIEALYVRVSARVTEELRTAGANDPVADAAIKTEVEAAEQRLQDITGEVTTDVRINIETLKTELADPALQTQARSDELLARSFDVPQEAGLRRAGGDTQYSFEHGATEVVRDSLQAKDLAVSEGVDASGLRTLVAEPAGGEPMVFVERAEGVAPPAREPRRILVPSAPPKPPPLAPAARRPRTGAKGDVFAEEGGITSQGATVVRQHFKGQRKLTAAEAQMEAAGNPAVLEHLVREHFRRSILRGEMTGRLIAGGKNIRQYADEIGAPHPRSVDLEQATIEFLNRAGNEGLRTRLVERLVDLRDSLRMPQDALTDAAIGQDPWTAAGRLREKAEATLPESHNLRRAAQDFVDTLSRTIGNLKPDMIVWDPVANSLRVIDATHTVGTRFQVFHEFKTMLYIRVFEMLTSTTVRGTEFRSPREQREF